MVLAGPHAVGMIQYRQPLLKPPIACVGQKAVGLGDGGRSEKIRVFFQDRAGRIARGAQDAVGGVVELQALFLDWMRSFSATGSSLIKKGLTERYFLKKSLWSTIRSRCTGR
jgi:hypothetical protein